MWHQPAQALAAAVMFRTGTQGAVTVTDQRKPAAARNSSLTSLSSTSSGPGCVSSGRCHSKWFWMPARAISTRITSPSMMGRWVQVPLHQRHRRRILVELPQSTPEDIEKRSSASRDCRDVAAALTSGRRASQGKRPTVSRCGEGTRWEGSHDASATLIMMLSPHRNRV